MNVLLSGGTGFIGQALIRRLVEKGHHVVLLTRHQSSVQSLSEGHVEIETWDAKTLGPWTKRLEQCNAVINLAGESIANKRWTQTQKKRIVSSRIDSTHALVEGIRKAQSKPQALINASAVGYYGPVEGGDVAETHPNGQGFLAETCRAWEKEALEAEQFGLRVALPRIGVVLEKGGGALSKILPPFQMFVGGPLGSGRQWFPWVHRDDVVDAIIFSLENESVKGPFNCVAPDPVTMKEFCTVLGQVMHRPSIAPVPAFVLKIMLGEMSEMLLTGQKAIPKSLKEHGYQFHYPKLQAALEKILRS